MEVDEDHVQTLLSMGFFEAEVRRALRLAKNDLNEAVAHLTDDHPPSFDALEDIDMQLVPKVVTDLDYGPSEPPGYDEVVDVNQPERENNSGMESESMNEELGPLEFPVTNLYELEGRVFAEQWSIPYKKEESLGKCLLAATRLSEENLADSDEHCARFLDRCMPECFQKLLKTFPVRRWNPETHEGIFNMLKLFIDLAATRLKHLPVHIRIMEVLSMAFDRDTEFQIKNCKKRHKEEFEKDMEKEGKLFTTTVNVDDPYGWLTNLINRFAAKKGFDYLQNLLENQALDAPSLASLLKPFGACAEFLNPHVVKDMMTPGMEKSILYVKKLDEKDFKEKKVGYVSDLLASMKLLFLQMWPQLKDSIDDLRLDVALRMLQSPHFNAKMNSLKELTKLMEDSTNSYIDRYPSGDRSLKKLPKSAISNKKLLSWLVEKRILSIALEGNIDQSQYCDKIKGIVDFIGEDLSQEELTMIWKMQFGKTNSVTDNLHSIIAAAAVKFDQAQLEHLFLLIQKKWQDNNDRMREKLLSLIGKIGRDARESKTRTRVLELLWDLSHLPVLTTQLIEQALEEHLAILSDTNVKEQVKRQYVSKCVDDIKKGACILPALKQLLQICKSILKQSQKTDKGILHELNKNHDIIKLVTNSLVKCHKHVVSGVGDGQLGQNTLVDGRYLHSEYVTTHLNFLHYILLEGALYLPTNRARDLWSTLIASPEACEWDRETGYDWFSRGLQDLENETQSQLFQKELLKMDPSKLSEKGFNCFRNFFEKVNINEQHRLRKENGKLIVEKTDLIGRDYIWEICLNTTDENIANAAIDLLLAVSYTNLNQRLKKDSVSLHRKFIDECKNRLEESMVSLGGAAVALSISWATKTLTASIVPEVANVPLPAKSIKLINIERLLWIAEAYVLEVEDAHQTSRTILPHGASFQGHLLNIQVMSDSPKQEFILFCHSNESLGSVRQKISNHLKQAPDNVQIVAKENMLGTNKDQKLLHQLEFEDNQIVQVRLASSSMSSSKDPPATPTSKQTFDFEQEKLLPGVIMAAGGHVFDMLYQLAELEEPRITARVRKLLMLIPTDAAVSDALDSICTKGVKLSSASGEDISPKASPRKSNPTPLSSPRLPPRDVLKAMFDANGPEMSAFRLLYNLEVLSSKLMPTACDIGTKLNSQSFCEDFLKCGGLQLVINILQAESLAPEVNYIIRQGCYSISLQLARFLLCGQTVTGEMVPSSSVTENHVEEVKPSAAIIGTTPPTLTSPLSIIVEKTVTAAGHTVQVMGLNEFKETVSCFMRVTWAAAAGRLHLLSSAQPIHENPSAYSYYGNRSRQSSTGSTASTGSDSDCQSLHGGVCVRQTIISLQDSTIAKEALELLVTCLQLRSELIASFYSLPYIADFIIDILVGCSQSDIREAALEQFYLLSQTDTSATDKGSNNSDLQTPHQFMLKVLLKAYLPFWVSSTTTRGASQRLLSQCSQYFELRCRLLQNLTEDFQQKTGIDVASMLDDEIAWLSNFTCSKHPDLEEIDNLLLAGHLKLIRTLYTCEGVDKEESGRLLVFDLLNDFLFPASKVMMDSLNSSSQQDLSEANPKCSSSESRVAAYDLMTELAKGSINIQKDISKQLIQMHHLPHPDCANEWEYLPPVDGRARCGFVGLRNGGATCYMNSVIQQLFLTPGIPEKILAVEEENPDEDSVFYQIQQVFGHLMESKLQYHEPERFWKVFQLWGQAINIREQQDAFDFFQALADQVDEHMKSNSRSEIFKNKFGGVFSDQKICKDCPHRYEREECFFALNLTVKNATLQDSLDQFVNGELLEGDNAYFCDKCGEKRNTIKRMCIKSLPPLLCIQLKRFGYDWEANRALKFDDYFKFPWVLDMEPYTAEGLSRREDPADVVDSNSESESGELSQSEDMVEIAAIAEERENKQINYELVGIVVHSGQANAGHYYSFIKDRRGSMMSNPNKNKWFKFNDTTVEEFDMNDESLEAECFGGTYKAKVYDNTSSFPDDRIRYWNGYMLFYERSQEPKTPSSAKKSKIIQKRPAPDKGMRSRLDSQSDSLMELTELVHKGERRGLFTEQMPAGIHQIIQAENLTFVKNRDVYNMDYFVFVKNLVSVNIQNFSDENFSEMCLHGLQLAVKFLFNTFFRTKKKTKLDLQEWSNIFRDILFNSKDSCMWLVTYLASEEGSSSIKPFLLECPNRDVRLTMVNLLDYLMTSYFRHGGIQTQTNFDSIVETLLLMLNKDVGDHCKNCYQFFMVLSNYAALGTKACTHLFLRRAFPRLTSFLLGHGSQDQESSSRRWSSIQSREFGYLHTTLAILILNCDISEYQTFDRGDYEPYKPKLVSPQKLLKMSPEMHAFVFGSESQQYIREIMHAVREISTQNTAQISEMIAYCSFCNKEFSVFVIKQLMMQYTNVPSNELKPIFTMLLELLTMADPLQDCRLRMIIEGHKDKSNVYAGLLTVIRDNHMQDSCRSYWCIKFLVLLASQCPPAKDYLMVIPSKWQWAVNWLKKKMSEYNWMPSTSTLPMSNEDSNSKSFQRTMSAQSTLKDANALLEELETQEGNNSDAENGDKSDMEVDKPSPVKSHMGSTLPVDEEMEEDRSQKSGHS